MDMAVQTQRRVYRQIGIIAVHVHAPVQRQIRHQRADCPKADHAQRLAVEFRTDKGGFAPLHHFRHFQPFRRLFAHPAHGPRHVAGGHQHSAENQLFHGVGVRPRRVEDRHARL